MYLSFIMVGIFFVTPLFGTLFFDENGHPDYEKINESMKK